MTVTFSGGAMSAVARRRVAHACFWDRPGHVVSGPIQGRKRLKSSPRFDPDGPGSSARYFCGDDPARSRWWMLMKFDYLLRQGRRNGRIFLQVPI